VTVEVHSRVKGTTVSRIIIAVDDSERAQDAVAFGGLLARSSGAAVTLAHAYPWHHLPLAGTTDVNRSMLEESERTIARVEGPLRDLADLETRSLAESSPARGLQELAAELDAGLIVVGSSHGGRLGRVFPGSTAERLLHGSPCPVAVVPHGYRNAKPDGFGVIACAWNSSPESEAALAAATELAERTSSALRVVHVVEPPAYLPFPPAAGVGYEPFERELRDHAERALEERMAHLPEAVRPEGELLVGTAARELAGVSDHADLLFIGSRGYGPLRAVLLGGVSGAVVRDAACPVIVVPNGVHHAPTSVFGAAAVTAAT
jgi:nucleotide-binding universal stress UspA family protein